MCTDMISNMLLFVCIPEMIRNGPPDFLKPEFVHNFKKKRIKRNDYFRKRLKTIL